MISIFSIPENIKFTFEVGPTTLLLFTRIVDLIDNRKEMKKLMDELSISTDGLDKVVKENPDPNPLT